MRKTKTGSSRRKGDEYQDLTALQFSLESYTANSDFELFIEYEKAGSLDDVCIISPSKVTALQVKHSVNDNDVYTIEDFTDEDSPVYLKKFADSWSKIAADFPDKEIELRLRSNRSINADIASMLDSTGCFDSKFRENRYYKANRELRTALFKASGLS
ncbi:MAG: dsDNA nuclease domain-containing protein, partial [Gammaproteobacteria bacterium]|nr:dsDNA nuclease domain-containing protein [Gammaproteobacteria bacterium]